MKKNKNKKNKAGNKTLLGGAAKSLKKLGSGIGRLSTTQKVVSGAALVALGVSYLNKRRRSKAGAATATPDATGAEDNLAAMDENA